MHSVSHVGACTCAGHGGWERRVMVACAGFGSGSSPTQLSDLWRVCEAPVFSRAACAGPSGFGEAECAPWSLVKLCVVPFAAVTVIPWPGWVGAGSGGSSVGF